MNNNIEIINYKKRNEKNFSKYNPNIKYIEYSKDLIKDSYVDYNLDNTFCIFKSINNILYLIYSNEKNSIISYNLVDDKKINEINNAHQTYITNFRYYYDESNKRDIILSISCENNNIKIWNINNWTCITNIEYVNDRGYLFSACLLKDNKNKIYLITSNAIENSEPLKIFDLKGNKIKEVFNSNDITYFIDIYYEYDDEKELNDIYIITANLGYIKTYNFCKNELYHKYCDNDNRGHCSILIYIDNFEIVKLIDSGHDGNIRIWNFHTGLLVNKIFINNSALYGITLWNDEYLFIGARDKSIKILELKSGSIIKDLKGHNNRVLTVKKIFHPYYGECLISQGFENEEIKLWSISI